MALSRKFRRRIFGSRARDEQELNRFAFPTEKIAAGRIEQQPRNRRGFPGAQMTGEKTHNSGTGHVTVGGQCSRKRQMGNEASCFLPLRGWSRTRKMQSR